MPKSYNGLTISYAESSGNEYEYSCLTDTQDFCTKDSECDSNACCGYTYIYGMHFYRHIEVIGRQCMNEADGQTKGRNETGYHAAYVYKSCDDFTEDDDTWAYLMMHRNDPVEGTMKMDMMMDLDFTTFGGSGGMDMGGMGGMDMGDMDMGDMDMGDMDWSDMGDMDMGGMMGMDMDYINWRDWDALKEYLACSTDSDCGIRDCCGQSNMFEEGTDWSNVCVQRRLDGMTIDSVTGYNYDFGPYIRCFENPMGECTKDSDCTAKDDYKCGAFSWTYDSEYGELVA